MDILDPLQSVRPRAFVSDDLERRCEWCGRRSKLIVFGSGVSGYQDDESEELQELGAKAEARASMGHSAALIPCPSCGRMPRECRLALLQACLLVAPVGGAFGALAGYLAADAAWELWLALLGGSVCALAAGVVAMLIRVHRARVGALIELVK
ncbi:MAG: hypothetical protein ACYC8T_11235 [Myxococcaceae bacterium]